MEYITDFGNLLDNFNFYHKSILKSYKRQANLTETQ